MDYREAVKKMLELNDRMLRAFGADGLANHRHVAKHYANGGEVEVYVEHHRRWMPATPPSFSEGTQYRIKPEPESDTKGAQRVHTGEDTLILAMMHVPENAERVSAVKRDGEWVVYYSEANDD